MSLALEFLLSAPLLVATAAPAQDTFELGFGVRTDAMEPVPHPILSVLQDGEVFAATGDARGETPTFALDASEEIVLVLEETPTTANAGTLPATTIGQQIELDAPDLVAGWPAPVEESSVFYYYFQPTARQIDFDSKSGEVATDGESGWLAVPESQADYAFTSWVAELPTKAVISRYLAYASGAHSTTDEHGVLFRMDQDVDLNAGGFQLYIDPKGYGYDASSNLTVRSVFVGGGSSALDVSLTSVTEDELVLHVQGTLQEGDNLVLVGEVGAAGAVSPAASLSGATQVSPPFYSSSGGCELPESPDEDDLIPIADESCDPGCNLTWLQSLICEAVPHGFANCESIFYWQGGPTSTDCGTQANVMQRCSTWEGGVSVSVSAGLPGSEVGLSVTAHGKISGTECQSVGAEPGYTIRPFIAIRKCTQLCDVFCEIAAWTKRSHCIVLDPDPIILTLTDQVACQFDDCEDD